MTEGNTAGGSLATHNQGIALLGASGFIGSRLADRLESHERPFGLLDIRKSLTGRETRITDVTDLESLRTSLDDYGALVNLAAEHRDDVWPPSRYQEINVQGAHHVCQVAREKSVPRIVFTSSVAVYGFAPPNTDEGGAFNPFNEYGRTKAEAESVYRKWQQEAPEERSLVIVRPTVVFGEGNRGNVYNLLKQIYSGRFLMVGDGTNAKSMAYVENIAAFLEHSLDFGPGVHVYNYVDKPDFDMNRLVAEVHRILGRARGTRMRVPYPLGYAGGVACDAAARLMRRSLPISAVRVQKFCSTTTFSTAVDEAGFRRPVSLEEGLERTVRYEFLEDHDGPVFYTE